MAAGVLPLFLLMWAVAGPLARGASPARVSEAYLDRLLRTYGEGGELSRAGLARLLAALGVSEQRPAHEHHPHEEHADHGHSQRQPADHERGLAPGDGHRHGHDGHDHGPETIDHGHESHDHGPDGHEGHDHGPDGHEGHDHGPDGHEGHDHGPDGHEGHDHGPDGHEGHDHGPDGHEGHDHGPDGHEGHDHGPDDHHLHGSGSHSEGDALSGAERSTVAVLAGADSRQRRDTPRHARQADLKGSGSPSEEVSDLTCPDVDQLLAEFGLTPESRLNAGNLSLLCPSLVYQAAAGGCRSARRGGGGDAEPHRPPAAADRPGLPNLQLWLFASLSVLAISLCGLAGVAVVPIMQRVVYRQLLQFLVALAVGTLAGDALLHLLPHVLAPHESHGHGGAHDEHGWPHADGEHAEHASHLDAVLKGLVALLSVMFFFAAERGIGILHATCTKAKHEKINKRLADMTGLDKGTTEMIEKKINNYRHSTGANHCFGDQDTMDVLARLNDTHDDACPEDRDAENHNLTPDCSQQPLTGGGGPSCSQPAPEDDGEKEPAAGHSHLKVPGEQRVRPADGSAGSSVEPASRSGGRSEEPCERFSAQERVARSSDFTVIIHEHEHRHHGHTHTHGHIHQPAGSSAAAVAGMVIVGDGLHNFTDGMAIGAAFAAGLASGLSTSVAVFCHELPHEVGDFAVLLQSGMSVRQALFYNVVSSVLCFLGMMLGMVLGNIESFSAWVFAAAAGSFLYIALVDMVPELTAGTGDADSSPCRNLTLQLAGMACGAGIMLCIAVYENDLHSLITVV